MTPNSSEQGAETRLTQALEHLAAALEKLQQADKHDVEIRRIQALERIATSLERIATALEGGQPHEASNTLEEKRNEPEMPKSPAPDAVWSAVARMKELRDRLDMVSKMQEKPPEDDNS